MRDPNIPEDWSLEDYLIVVNDEGANLFRLGQVVQIDGLNYRNGLVSLRGVTGPLEWWNPARFRKAEPEEILRALEAVEPPIPDDVREQISIKGTTSGVSITVTLTTRNAKVTWQAKAFASTIDEGIATARAGATKALEAALR